MRVAQYMEPADRVQRVCDHPGQIIALQIEITDLKARQFLPQHSDHLEMEGRIRTVTKDLQEGRTRPAVEGTNEQLRDTKLAVTQDAQQSGEEVWGLRVQLANALTLAARAAPAAPQALEDWSQKYPDSPDIVG